MAIRIDWDKWYRITQVLPQDVIGDKNTGLIQLATSKKAFEKYIAIMTAETEPAETAQAPKKLKRRAGGTMCMVDRKTLVKYLTEDQRMALLDDEEFYRLNPEYWEEFGMVIKD